MAYSFSAGMCSAGLLLSPTRSNRKCQLLESVGLSGVRVKMDSSDGKLVPMIFSADRTITEDVCCCCCCFSSWIKRGKRWPVGSQRTRSSWRSRPRKCWGPADPDPSTSEAIVYSILQTVQQARLPWWSAIIIIQIFNRWIAHDVNSGEKLAIFDDKTARFVARNYCVVRAARVNFITSFHDWSVSNSSCVEN